MDKNKKKSKKISKKRRIFKRGDLVEIIWDDAFACQDVWIANDEMEQHFKPVTIKTIGQFITAKEGYVYLSMCTYGDDYSYCVGGAWGIPSGFIRSINKLKG